MKENNDNKKIHNLLLGGTILVVAVLLIGASLLMKKGGVEEKHMLTLEEKKEVADQIVSLYGSEKAPNMGSTSAATNELTDDPGTESPGGYIVISGHHGTAPQQSTQLYTIDLSKGGSPSSTPELLIPKYVTSAMAEFNDRVNPSDFFMLTASKYSMAQEEDKVGIHHYSAASGNIRPYSSTKGRFERNLEWTATGGLLAFNRFVGTDKTNVDLLPIDNWETVIVDVENDKEVTTIPGSWFPKWSPDGTQLLVLKTDGLYLFTVSSASLEKVVPVGDGGKVIGTSMIDVSSDGTHLLWTTAKAGIITIGEISSWAPFSMKEIGRIEDQQSEFYWPLFSPDGKFYAVQAIDRLKGDETFRQNPRLEVHPLKSKAAVFKQSLADFVFDALFTDAWVAHDPRAPKTATE